MLDLQIELQPSEFAGAFDKWRHAIEKALPLLNGTTTLDGLYEGVERGHVCFWNGPRAWAFSYVLQHELCRSMNVFLAGGEDTEALLAELLPVIERAARAAHCKFVHMDARMGFIKHSAKYGYNPVTICFAKELSDG